MALFEYFPNYIWNLSVAIAVASGAELGEIVDMCEPIKRAADEGADAGTPEFMKQWARKADTLASMAEEDLARGRKLSAADKLRRASLYYITAERMQGHGHPGRAETYAKAQSAFSQYIEYGKENCERVEIPYKGATLPALYTRAEGVEGEAPCIVFTNGLDSCKELLYWTWLPHALARRGISTLCVDQPGSGEAIRKQDMPATPYSEEWATPCYEYLAGRDDVDAERIGISGISLGGHFAARAAAYEPRFASGAIWGANHNWYEVQVGRLDREGENPVPHYWKHVYWVFGADNKEDFFKKIEGMNMNGHMDRIKMPFLITHGENDRQINVKYAHQAFEQLSNSAKPELKIFTSREGGVEHVGADNMSFGRDYIADWFADTLGGRTE
ncbi:MAG: prolyl oligopeptidase family serine peptidase [Henriciella sp.]|uniref:alpha/beta hydrolase family protein n=1 Tax=Henriciella sp. TaxID=1968823 RepID=UPI003C733400